MLTAALLLAACGAEPSPSPGATFFFPQHGGLRGNGFEAALQGVVVYADRCLWVQSTAGERYLVLWPSDVILSNIGNGPAILAPTDRELIVETGSGAIIGGRRVDLETAIQLVGPIPERCAGDSFWEASAVDSFS